MNDERLLMLRDLMGRVDPAKFNMDYWGFQSPACGTVACAWGMAAMQPEFEALGVNLVWRGGGVFQSATPYYAGLGGYGAAEAFFGLSEIEAEYLFDASSYYSRLGRHKVMPQEVIEHIDTLAKTGLPERCDVDEDDE